MRKVRWILKIKGRQTWGMVTRGRWEVRFYPFSWLWPVLHRGYRLSILEFGPFTISWFETK